MEQYCPPEGQDSIPPTSQQAPAPPTSKPPPTSRPVSPTTEKTTEQENYNPAASGTVCKHSSEPTWGRAGPCPLDDERDPLQRAVSPTQ